MDDEELKRALYGLVTAIKLTPLPDYSGMGLIRDRAKALKLAEDAIGYTYENWWAYKKAHLPEEP